MTVIHIYYFCFSLLSSVQSLDKSSQRTHIFVGIDVFGRGCLGGGGLNSDIALKKIREVGLSTAIFAPGISRDKNYIFFQFEGKMWLYYTLKPRLKNYAYKRLIIL